MVIGTERKIKLEYALLPSENNVSKRAVEFLKENPSPTELWPMFLIFTMRNRYHYLWKCRVASPRQDTV